MTLGGVMGSTPLALRILGPPSRAGTPRRPGRLLRWASVEDGDGVLTGQARSHETHGLDVCRCRLDAVEERLRRAAPPGGGRRAWSRGIRSRSRSPARLSAGTEYLVAAWSSASTASTPFGSVAGSVRPSMNPGWSTTSYHGLVLRSWANTRIRVVAEHQGRVCELGVPRHPVPVGRSLQGGVDRGRGADEHVTLLRPVLDLGGQGSRPGREPTHGVPGRPSRSAGVDLLLHQVEQRPGVEHVDWT